ncbi:MAG TPA: (Fe-S)-binding protein [Bacteroidia bacterium]|jgi:L-lactate dehydrogenase complex protein LldE|nr:(Fe-S)-binding protein [Bacteroidia bacterium]
MIVDLFIPCFVDQLYPETALNMVKVLERVGCGVNYNHEQTCCGQPAHHAGYWDHCKEVGEKFIREFQNDRYIVSPSASCTGFVKNYYGDMFQNSVLHNQHRQVQKNMYEFSDFLVNILKITDLGAKMNGVAVYHDSCSALREYGIHREPRLLLSKVRGLEMREMENTETCCGFGGMFSTKFETVSSGMAEQKLLAAEKAGAEYIISTDLSCLSHLEGYIKKQNKNIRIMHLIDVLVQGWD